VSRTLSSPRPAPRWNAVRPGAVSPRGRRARRARVADFGRGGRGCPGASYILVNTAAGGVPGQVMLPGPRRCRTGVARDLASPRRARSTSLRAGASRAMRAPAAARIVNISSGCRPVSTASPQKKNPGYRASQGCAYRLHSADLAGLGAPKHPFPLFAPGFIRTNPANRGPVDALGACVQLLADGLDRALRLGAPDGRGAHAVVFFASRTRGL